VRRHSPATAILDLNCFITPRENDSPAHKVQDKVGDEVNLTPAHGGSWQQNLRKQKLAPPVGWSYKSWLQAVAANQPGKIKTA